MISDEVLQGRIPRLGTITVGRTTLRNGRELPTKTDTLVVHTDDEQLAKTVLGAYGGELFSDGGSWGFDAVTEVRQMEVEVLPAGFRQALESWRTAECVRRCDGITMSMRDGRPTTEACVCNVEMAGGAERLCKPSTILPVLLDLDIERFGVFEVRSTAWGTANSLKGAMQAVAMVASGASRVPGLLHMVDRTVRDATDKVREVVELQLTILHSARQLATLPAGAPELTEVGHRSALDEALALHERAFALGLRDTITADYRTMFPSRGNMAELTDEELGDWATVVQATIADAEGEAQTARPAQVPATATIEQGTGEVVRPCPTCGKTLVGAKLAKADGVYVHAETCA